MVISNLGIAAGGCVLASGLFLGSAGGAIAWADTGSSGSASHSQAGGSGSGGGSGAARSTVTSSTSSLKDILRTTLQGVTGALGSGQLPGLPTSSGSASPNSTTATAGTNKDSGLASAVPPNLVVQLPKAPAPAANVGAQVSDPVEQASNPPPAPNQAPPAPNSAPPAPNRAPPAPNQAPPAPNQAPAVLNPAPPAPNPGPPALNPAPLASNLLGPIDASNLFGPIENVVAQLPEDVQPFIAQLPEVVQPLFTQVIASVPLLVGGAIDVITAVEDTVTSVATGVMPLAQLPNALLSDLGFLGEPGVIGPQGASNHELVIAAGVPALTTPTTVSQLLLPVRVASVPEIPMVGDAAGLAPLGGLAMPHLRVESSPPQAAAPAPYSSSLMDVPLHIVQALGKILRSASLEELALAALPGIGGLLFFTGAGVGLGQRQAKAGFLLETSGITRFVRPGPLGVVRSGSLVVLRRPKAGAERARGRAA